MIESSYKYDNLSGWFRLLEILQLENFINMEGHLCFPDVQWYDLSPDELTSVHQRFIWFNTCKMAITHQLLVADGNGNILSNDDVMEHYVLEHIIGINNQLKSLPKRHHLNKVFNRIKKISSRFGVQINTDLFQLTWIENDHVTLAHPIVLYLDQNGSKYFSKLIEFHKIIKDKLWTQKSTILLNDWSKELIIPSMKLDVFFNDDRQENIKFSSKTISRTFNKLMILIKHQDKEGSKISTSI
jgi:hypothetical protein